MMTPKKAEFARQYLVDLNATKSAERAGYSQKTAYSQGQRLLKDVDVQDLIQQAMEDRSKRTEITADWVLANIVEIGQRCLQRYPVMVGQGKDREQLTEKVATEDGEEVLAQVFEFDAQAALKAQELLGKHLKLFTEKHEVTGNIIIQASPEDERL